MNTKQIEVFSGDFDKARVRSINSKVDRLFNDYTDKGLLITILVVVQTKNGEQKQNWCTVGRTKPENISFIALYEVEQELEMLN